MTRCTSRTSFVALIAAVVAALGAQAPARSLDGPPTDLDAGALLAASGVGLPPDGVTLQLHADFPEDSPLVVAGAAFTSVTADVAPDGSVTVLSALPAEPAATSGSKLDECTDPAFAPTGPRWYASDLPVRWRFRRASVPDGLGRFRSQYSLQAAHQVWSRARNECRSGDDISLQFLFAGDTRRKAGYDGVNVVDFGPLESGALAMSYTWYSGGHILEADLRLNRTDYRWTNRPGGKSRFQVENVAAHEIGHQLGLDDLGDPHGALTMFGRIARGEMSKTTLGRGDLRGASALSP